MEESTYFLGNGANVMALTAVLHFPLLYSCSIHHTQTVQSVSSCENKGCPCPSGLISELQYIYELFIFTDLVRTTSCSLHHHG